MELINDLYKYKELANTNPYILKEAIEVITVVVAPFAPHIGEELWQMIGNEGSVFNITWPKYDESALSKDEIEVIVQVNGKLRCKLSLPSNISKEEMEKIAIENEKIKEHIEGKNVVKIIAVPKKLINIVVK